MLSLGNRNTLDVIAVEWNKIEVKSETESESESASDLEWGIVDYTNMTGIANICILTPNDPFIVVS